MADISKITLPSGTTYNIKDEEARTAIASITTFDYVICTNAANTPKDVQWQSGGTTITGTLVASADTKGKMYLVPDSLGTKDIYDEYITINTSGSTYIWERFGHTGGSIGDLGDLAYKDSASGNFTPTGTVSQPTFSGSSLTSTGNFTPSGSVTISKGTGTTNYTPEGSVSAPTISKSTAGSTTTVNSITDVGSLPSWSGTVSNEILTIAWSAGTLPTKGSNTTVKTGDASYTASTPSFTGTAVQLKGSFSGTQGSVSVTGTPAGTVSQPTFTGTQGTVTVS